jgi:exodeoxyribonuclease VII large subunit
VQIFEFDPFPETSQKLTVSQLTRDIKILLENSLPVIWLEGEISNFKHHSSGHMYFSLKDEDAQIPCVMWRGRNTNLYFTPADGMKILALGQVTVYEKRGAYQFDIQQIQPAGVGELQRAFDRLKEKLKAEGLFDEEFKKPLPKFPERIGIVTSPTGAAIQDLLNVLGRRFPPAEIIFRPAKVQGEGAATDIARAIDEFNEFGAVDVLIVGRGGGSIEDLWAFNEEVVARAIFRSKIPIISAVGHEVDFCISDFVADMRAPTPSAAAELAVPNGTELNQKLVSSIERIYFRITEKIESHREQLKHLTQSYGFRRPVDLIHQYQQRLDELHLSLKKSIQHRLALDKERIKAFEKHLAALNPTAILARGYSICFVSETNEIVKNVSQLKPQDEVKIQFHLGQAWGDITRVTKNQ